MQMAKFDIPGPLLLTPERHMDDRGEFMETFRLDKFREALKENVEFIQENLSRTRSKGTLRGLHFQSPPAAQGKLVRCTKGHILDVIVDIRSKSANFGQHIAINLKADLVQHLWVPVGFAHGFITLEADCEVLYKTTAYYAPKLEGAIHWSDPDLDIYWGIAPDNVICSEKDSQASAFAELNSPF